MANKYVEKANVKSVKTQYGEILKIGIHKDIFTANNVEGEWFNIDVLRSKEGNKPYLVINDYKKPAETDEIPY